MTAFSELRGKDRPEYNIVRGPSVDVVDVSEYDAMSYIQNLFHNGTVHPCHKDGDRVTIPLAVLRALFSKFEAESPAAQPTTING